MSSFTLTFRAKEMSFDRQKVQNAAGRMHARALSRAGAFVRRTARQSMRKRRGPSRPGTPPSVHQGDLKRFLWFAYEPTRTTVVIGPVGFARSTVPLLLETGGFVTVYKWKTVNGRRLRVPERRRLAARPYMGPALRANLSVIPQQYRGALAA